MSGNSSTNDNERRRLIETDAGTVSVSEPVAHILGCISRLSDDDMAILLTKLPSVTRADSNSNKESDDKVEIDRASFPVAPASASRAVESGVNKREEADSIPNNDDVSNKSGVASQGVKTLKLTPCSTPTMTDIINVVDQLFQEADKNSVTVQDIKQSVASHFGCDKVDVEVKEAIKARLTDLVKGEAAAPASAAAAPASAAAAAVVTEDVKKEYNESTDDESERGMTSELSKKRGLPKDSILASDYVKREYDASTDDDSSDKAEQQSTKKQRCNVGNKEGKQLLIPCFESLIEQEVLPALSPPDDPSFARQEDYLHTFFHSLYDEKRALTWENLSTEISQFLSYYMVRKIYGENEEGLRSAARAMHNLVNHFNVNGIIRDKKSDEARWRGEVLDASELLAYTKDLAKYPYEVGVELQKLWDTFYWEKKEEVYPHLKKSKFTLEPGDSYTRTSDGGVEEEVTIKESDMVMTKGDINNNLGGEVSIYLAVARVMGVLFRDRGLGGSSREYLVRGQSMRIYCGHNAKEEASQVLENYRVDSRQYEETLVDSPGGRIQIRQVCKDGWWMAPESSWGLGSRNGVFVPLTAKVAKMGVEGSVFSGMRLGLAGGVWRPLPSGTQVCPTICYNVYPPDFNDWPGRLNNSDS